MQAMTIEDVLKATGGTLLSGDIHQTFNDVISDSRKVTAGVLLCRLSVKSLTVTIYKGGFRPWCFGCFDTERYRAFSR